MIRTRVKFEAAHRQLGDKGKCGFLHGHRWMGEIEIDGKINDIGYIVDFKELKEIVEPMDHAVILNEDDKLVNILREHKQKVYTLYGNPTCENLANHILDIIIETYCNVTYCSVKIWETEDSWAQSTTKI